MCEHIFGDSAGESTSSSTSSMKGGNSGNNTSDLDKGNILKSTFDTLTEEGVTPHVMEGLIKSHRLQSSIQARANQVVEVRNQCSKSEVEIRSL
jgi:hypothetical protein